MNILYIAYSCSPNHGSEDRIGWQVPLAASAHHRVTVLTKEEHRAVIESYQQAHPELNIRFYYVDIPSVYKKIYKGPLYAGRLNIWQKRAVTLAQRICREQEVEVIHQITPVEFRSIGDYGRIPGVRFICGPVGGGEHIPWGLWAYARRHIPEEGIRRLANGLSLLSLRCRGVLKRCDGVLYANEETRQVLQPLVGADRSRGCYTEIGIDADEISVDDRPVPTGRRVFLVAGRLVYRKGLELLLDALRGLPPELDYECRIVGSGPQAKQLKEKCRAYGLEERVFFEGRVPFEKMADLYHSAHVLVMPSIRETTGSVLLEAMARGLPVIATGRFGAAVVLDDTTGWPYDGHDRFSYIAGLQKALERCIHQPDEVAKKAAAARLAAGENTWSRKAAYYSNIYTH